jgi:Mg-chelatase subunit ChlD
LLDDVPVDRSAHQAARDIASRLAIRRPPRLDQSARGTGRSVSARYRGDADELDVDRTLEVLVEQPRPAAEDLIVRTQVRSRRALALLVDVSGSMKGHKVAMVAATVGALAAELSREEVSVIAFWQDCAVLTDGRQPVSPTRLLDDLLRLPTQGLTNVHAPLELAGKVLARSAARHRAVLLLSDCVHNAGPDPRLAVRALPRLHVLLQRDGEHDAWLAAELARLGGGRLAVASSARDVAPAVNRLLGPS